MWYFEEILFNLTR